MLRDPVLCVPKTVFIGIVVFTSIIIITGIVVMFIVVTLLMLFPCLFSKQQQIINMTKFNNISLESDGSANHSFYTMSILDFLNIKTDLIRLSNEFNKLADECGTNEVVFCEKFWHARF